MQRVERSHRRLAQQILGTGEPFPARMPTESKTAPVPRVSVFPPRIDGDLAPELLYSCSGMEKPSNRPNRLAQMLQRVAFWRPYADLSSSRSTCAASGARRRRRPSS